MEAVASLSVTVRLVSYVIKGLFTRSMFLFWVYKRSFTKTLDMEILWVGDRIALIPDVMETTASNFNW